MKYFLVPVPGGAHAVAKVPKGQTLAEVGHEEGDAIEVPRLPRPHEIWDGEAGGWKLDEKAAAAAELQRRANLISAGGLLAKIEELDKPLLARVEAMEKRLAAMEATLAKGVSGVAAASAPDVAKSPADKNS